MRDLFPGYYQPTKQEFQKLWAEAVFSFDANVLLNLYRFTEDSRTILLNVLGKIKDRVWLTYQAAQEFHDNRCEVAMGQPRIYGEIVTILENAIKEIEKRFRRIHLFRDTELSKTVVSDLKVLVGKMYVMKKKHPNYEENDILQEFLAGLFQGKVGSPYSVEEFDSKCREAAKRFEKKIPPGYEDDGDKSKPGQKRFGDAIIWFQLMDHAKTISKPIIFLTDDDKDDWWLRVNGKRIGPRPELLQEFLHETKQRCHIYSTDLFLELARSYLDVAIEQKTIDEAKEIRRQKKGRISDVAIMLKRVTRQPLLVDSLTEIERSYLIDMMHRVRIGDVPREIIDSLTAKDKTRIAQLYERLVSGESLSDSKSKTKRDAQQVRNTLRFISSSEKPLPTSRDDPPSTPNVPKE